MRFHVSCHSHGQVAMNTEGPMTSMDASHVSGVRRSTRARA